MRCDGILYLQGVQERLCFFQELCILPPFPRQHWAAIGKFRIWSANWSDCTLVLSRELWRSLAAICRRGICWNGENTQFPWTFCTCGTISHYSDGNGHESGVSWAWQSIQPPVSRPKPPPLPALETPTSASETPKYSSVNKLASSDTAFFSALDSREINAGYITRKTLYAPSSGICISNQLQRNMRSERSIGNVTSLPSAFREVWWTEQPINQLTYMTVPREVKLTI